MFFLAQVETLPNAKIGDALSFWTVDTLTRVHTATVVGIARIPFADPRVKAAQAVVDGLDANVGPPFEPADVWFADASGQNVSRVWEVALDAYPNASLGGLLASLDAWDNSGAVLDGNYFHSSFDGV